MKQTSLDIPVFSIKLKANGWDCIMTLVTTSLNSEKKLLWMSVRLPFQAKNVQVFVQLCIDLNGKAMYFL